MSEAQERIVELEDEIRQLKKQLADLGEEPMGDDLDAVEIRRLIVKKMVKSAKTFLEIREGMLPRPPVQLTKEELNELLDLTVSDDCHEKDKLIVFECGVARGAILLNNPLRVVFRQL